MDLASFYKQNPRLLTEETAYLERLFLETVFYPEFGPDGLKNLQYQYKIHDTEKHRNYYIDFIVRIGSKTIAIELDGYNYHGKLSGKEFEKQEERTNEIIRQGYELIRFSYYKVKNNPNSVRGELRRRLSALQTSTAFLQASGYGSSTKTATTISRISHNVKSNIAPVLISLLVFAILVPLAFIFIAVSPLNKHSTIISKTSNNKSSSKSQQLANIDKFINYYNSRSSSNILRSSVLDILDTTNNYYRKTNTYYHSDADDSPVAVHGEIDKSHIWIISCSSSVPTRMRIYLESDNYSLLTEAVHISIPYLNPDSANITSKLANFDAAIRNSRAKLFVNFVGSTYVALKTGETTNWRLNLNTGCADLWY